MSDPALSMIMPIWGRPQRTLRAIRSALAQTRTDWELWIVGDADPNLSAIQAQLPADDRLRFHNMPEHEGTWGCAPRNWALERVNGRFVSFLDSDDYILPHHVADRVNGMETTGADLIAAFTIINFPQRQIRGGAIACGVVGNQEITFTREVALKTRFRSRIYEHDWKFILDAVAGPVPDNHNPAVPLQPKIKVAIWPGATYIVTHIPGKLEEKDID
jgi:glycosyltransferase involved in cell wall biosynthesis